MSKTIRKQHRNKLKTFCHCKQATSTLLALAECMCDIHRVIQLNGNRLFSLRTRHKWERACEASAQINIVDSFCRKRYCRLSDCSYQKMSARSAMSTRRRFVVGSHRGRVRALVYVPWSTVLVAEFIILKANIFQSWLIWFHKPTRVCANV